MQARLINNNLTNFEGNPISFEDAVEIWVMGDKKVGGGVNADRLRLLSRNCN
jgi:hypothetical protein